MKENLIIDSEQELEQIIQVQIQFLKKRLFNPGVKIYREKLAILLSLVKEIEHLADCLEKGNSDASDLIECLRQIEEVFQTSIKYDGLSAWNHVEKIINSSVADWPKQIVIEQNEQRFVEGMEDSFWIQQGKRMKRLARLSQEMQLKFLNSVRRYQEKEEINFTKWTQQVPIQGIWEETVFEQLTNFLEEISFEYVHLIQRFNTFFHRYLPQIHGFNKLSNDQQTDVVSQLRKESKVLKEELKAKQQQFGELFNTVKVDFENKLFQRYQLGGTIELTEKKIISNEKRHQYDSTVSKKLVDRQKKWKEQWKAELNFITQFRELHTLNAEIEKNIDTINKELSELFSSIVTEGLSQVTFLFDKIAEKNSRKSIIHKKGNAFRTHLEIQLTEIKELFEGLKNRVKQELTETVQERIQQYEVDLEEAILKLSERTRVITDNSTDTSKPHSNFHIQDWQPLIKRIISATHQAKLANLNIFFHEISDETTDILRTVSEVMDTNVYSAIHKAEEISNEGLENPEEKQSFEAALDIIESAILRSKSQIASFKSQKEEQFNDVLIEFEQSYTKTYSDLIDLWKSYQLSELENQRRSIQVRTKAINWKTRVEIYWAKTEDISIQLVSISGTFISKWVNRINEFLNPTTAKQTKKNQIQLGEFLIELEAIIKRLPYVYRKLFDYEGKADLNYQYVRVDAVQNFKSALNQWEKGFHHTVAIIGEQGSGRSFFMNKLSEELNNELTITRIQPQKPVTNTEELWQLLSNQFKTEIHQADDLISVLHANPKPCVIVDSLEKFFLRNVHGFSALEELILLINETSEHIFWVVSSARYTWNYLDKVFELHKHFSVEIEMDHLSKDQIKEILTKRHKLSGFQIRFEPDEELRKSRTYKKLQGNEIERQSYLENVFFETISEVAKGNIRIAMIHWLRSIHEVKELEIVLIVQSDLMIELPSVLSDSDFFSLTAIIIHGSLTAENHAEIFNESIKASRLHLSRLIMLNLLDKKGDTYSINVFAFRSIVSQMKRKNILH